jgi:hypothetical protein
VRGLATHDLRVCFNARMTSDAPWWFTMPPEEVAAAILPLFSSPQFSPSRNESLVMDKVVAWCKTGQFADAKRFRSLPGMKRFTDPDFRAIAEAIQVLEQCRLIMRYISDGDTTTCYLGLTRRGMHALATNTVRRQVGLGDPPPTVGVGHGNAAAAKLLVDLGFDVNNLNRTTPLHNAAWNDDIDMARTLISLGADPSIEDTEHHSNPLGWAEYSGKNPTADYLRSLPNAPD